MPTDVTPANPPFKKGDDITFIRRGQQYFDTVFSIYECGNGDLMLTTKRSLQIDSKWCMQVNRATASSASAEPVGGVREKPRQVIDAAKQEAERTGKSVHIERDGWEAVVHPSEISALRTRAEQAEQELKRLTDGSKSLYVMDSEVKAIAKAVHLSEAEPPSHVFEYTPRFISALQSQLTASEAARQKAERERDEAREKMFALEDRVYGCRELWLDGVDEATKATAQAEANVHGLPCHINVHGVRQWTARPQKDAEQSDRISALQAKVKQMVREGWQHVRKGTVLGKEDWRTLVKHLREEVDEFASVVDSTDEISEESKRNQGADELGDILGIVVHAAVKLGVSMWMVEWMECRKLDKRFKQPEANSPQVQQPAPECGETAVGCKSEYVCGLKFVPLAIAGHVQQPGRLYLELTDETRRRIETLSERCPRCAELESLVRHCYVHSSFPNCGYSQMSGEMKSLYNRVKSQPVPAEPTLANKISDKLSESHFRELSERLDANINQPDKRRNALPGEDQCETIYNAIRCRFAKGHAGPCAAPAPVPAEPSAKSGEEPKVGDIDQITGHRWASHDFPEDTVEFENGQYMCQCANCKVSFVGHPNRVMCKVCAKRSGRFVEPIPAEAKSEPPKQAGYILPEGHGVNIDRVLSNVFEPIAGYELPSGKPIVITEPPTDSSAGKVERWFKNTINGRLLSEYEVNKTYSLIERECLVECDRNGVPLSDGGKERP